MKAAKASEAPKPTAQKTLFDFFGKKSQAPAATIIKVSCPACSLQVPQSKINWHLDQDCKSRSKAKRKIPLDKNLVKRKKILKSVKDDIASKKRQKVMLSDDDSDACDSDDADEVKILDDDETDADEPYITASMLETRIFEINGEVDCKSPVKGQGSSSDTTSENTVSPYFSPNSKNSAGSPSKRSEKVVDYQVPSSSSSYIAMLESDWTSPHSTPPKFEEGKDGALGPPRKVTTPESNCASQEVREMLEKDWSISSTGSTPRKLSLNERRPSLSSISKAVDELEDFEPSLFKLNTPRKVNKECSKGSPSLKDLKDEKKSVQLKRKMSPDQVFPADKSVEKVNSTLPTSVVNGDSEDEFEANPIQFRTPEKPLRKRLKTLLGSSTKKDKIVSEGSRPSSIPSSPVSVCSEGSEPLFTPLQSPSLVSPTRSPSPLVNSGEGSSSVSNVNGTTEDKCVRKLFTPHNSPSKTSQESAVEPQTSTSKVRLSQSISSSTNRFSKIDKVLIGEGDPFDMLCNASSQESSVGSSQSQELPSSQSSQGNSKIWVRTPRKINQSIKCTGLLQNSPQNVSSSFIARKRQNSTSPEKREGSSQDLSQSSQGKSPYKEYDKAQFRGHKGYYLENFLMIMGTVLSESSDLQLFDEEDMSVVKNFHGLSLEAQKLYVRLFQRKMKWNKVSKIEYRDICDTDDMQLYVNELSYANFLLMETELNDLEEVLQLLSAEDLKGLCKHFKLSATGKKEDMANALLKFTRQQRSVMSVFSQGSSNDSIVLKKAKESMGRSCIINREVRRVFMRIIMLYGLPRYDEEDERGNHTQLTALLLVNMGKMNFPKYDLIRHHSIFRSRDDLIRFEGCSQILSDIHECLDGQKWEEALNYCNIAMSTYEELISDRELIVHDLSLPTFLRCYTSISILIHILSCSVECYQRLKNYRKAVERLEFLLNQTTHLQDYRGRWYDRLALNLEMHLKSPRAVGVIREALNDPEVRKGHRLALSIRAERMAASSRFKSLAPSILELPLMNPREAPKVIIEGRCLPGDAGYKKVFIRQDSDRHAGEGAVTVCSVEELVLQYYKDKGYTEGLHREGTTINSLFGLFFWDVLYSPVPDVFRSPHQAAPLDLNDSHFYTSRKELIEERLSKLRNWTDEEAGAEMERIWNEHMGKVAVVAWDIFRTLEYAQGLAASITMPVLSSICRRLAEDYRFSRSGFPDLVVWDPVKKRSCIVEVKGPNDRLSTKQILWLDYLLEHGATAEVCHVEAIGAKKMKLASPRRISPKKRSPIKKRDVEPKKCSPVKKRDVEPKKRSPVKKRNVEPKKRSPVKKKNAEIAAEKSTSESHPKSKDEKGTRKQTIKQSKKAAKEEDESVKPRRSSRNQSEDGKEKCAPKKKCNNDEDDFEEQVPKKSRRR